MSYEYYVRFVFDYANIGVCVVIDEQDEDKAERVARETLAYEGIVFPEPIEVTWEFTAEILV